MAELGRRLRTSVVSIAEDFVEVAVQAPPQEAPRTQPQSPRIPPVPTRAYPEAGAPAVDESANVPSLPGDPGGQPDEAAVEQMSSVDELAQRVPAEARAVLDELFRVKWTEVRRLRVEDLWR
jgi:hypothetical protein